MTPPASPTLQPTDAHERALVITPDVTRPAGIDAAVAATREKFGRIDVLVNNAG